MSARDHTPFTKLFTLEGDSLKRAPKGIDPDHPLIEDLRRKDFIAVREMTEKDATKPRFADEVAKVFGHASLFMQFLCKAVGVPY